MTTNLFNEQSILDLKNNVLDKISFVVTSGPLVGQLIHYSNIRYDKINDILHFNYSFEKQVEVDDSFDLNDYLSTLLKTHLTFKK